MSTTMNRETYVPMNSASIVVPTARAELKIRLQVQLETSHDISIPIPPAVASTSSPTAAANEIFALIEREEAKLQTSLNDAYQEMRVSEKALSQGP